MCPSHLCATESVQNTTKDPEVNNKRWQERKIDAKLKELIFIKPFRYVRNCSMPAPQPDSAQPEANTTGGSYFKRRHKFKIQNDTHIHCYSDNKEPN